MGIINKQSRVILKHRRVYKPKKENEIKLMSYIKKIRDVVGFNIRGK